uniref:Uncharacterized protein n=1 Tax=Marseillevirus LCMAC101 TaxID=2506602 RepID=A0A481YT07_9VIRU|nr:MAG: hypothetical protein LCMAC101_06920 [Marseillevirus LCMAC101]
MAITAAIIIVLAGLTIVLMIANMGIIHALLRGRRYAVVHIITGMRIFSVLKKDNIILSPSKVSEKNVINKDFLTLWAKK